MPNALVTGASTGFGAGTLRTLRDRGWTAYGTSRRPDAASSPDAPALLALDLRDDASISALGEFVRDLDDGLRALVSNAGIAVNGPWEEMTSAELRAQLEVNLVGTMAVVRECLPALRRGGGVIVQVTSISGLIGDAGFGAYNASKFGLEGASEALTQEVRDQGVRVVLIEPGPFRTPIVDAGDEIAGRGDGGRYTAVWRGLDEWREWFRNNAEDPQIVINTIVAAIERDDAPFRIPVGSKVPSWVRSHVEQLLADVDASERFVEEAQGPG